LKYILSLLLLFWTLCFFIIIIEAQRDRMVVDLQLPMQSVTITTNIVSWNPATYINISFLSWRSVLLVEETGENYRAIENH
jgi:hypothetical protein